MNAIAELFRTFIPDEPTRCPDDARHHRIDFLKCCDCGRLVCAWHYWVGDDDRPYCPPCAPKHRTDKLPQGGDP